MSMDRIPEILGRLERLERDMSTMTDRWMSSVDDIKATIKAEVGELKAEQIADLRQAIKDRDRLMAEIENRVRDVENAQRDWNAGKTTLVWLIRFVIAAAGLIAGFIGAKHL